MKKLIFTIITAISFAAISCSTPASVEVEGSDSVEVVVDSAVAVVDSAAVVKDTIAVDSAK